MVDKFLSNNIWKVNIPEFMRKNKMVEIPVVFSKKNLCNPLRITCGSNNNLIISCNYFGLFRYVFARNLYFKSNLNSRSHIIITVMSGLFGSLKDSTCLVRCNNEDNVKVTKVWSLLKYLQNKKLCFIVEKENA